MTRRRSNDPFDRWWSRIRDVGASIFGGYILLEQVGREVPQLSLVAVGAMLLVVPAASLAQRWLKGKIEDEL